jgi:hypothetical protein
LQGYRNYESESVPLYPSANWFWGGSGDFADESTPYPMPTRILPVPPSLIAAGAEKKSNIGAPGVVELVPVEVLDLAEPRAFMQEVAEDRRSHASLRRGLLRDGSLPDASSFEPVQPSGRARIFPKSRFLGRDEEHDTEPPLQAMRQVAASDINQDSTARFRIRAQPDVAEADETPRRGSPFAAAMAPQPPLQRAPPGFDEWLASSNAQAMRQVAASDMNQDSTAPFRIWAQPDVAEADETPRRGSPFANALAPQPPLQQAQAPLLPVLQPGEAPAPAFWFPGSSAFAPSGFATGGFAPSSLYQQHPVR